MSYVFLPDAQDEFLEAVLRYERERDGLGMAIDE